MANLSVIGAGAWGTALSIHASRAGHQVTLWAFEPDVAAEIDRDHRNSTFLPGVDLPAGILASADLGVALRDAEHVILVVPSQHVRGVAARMAPYVGPDAVVVVAAKGIEEDSLKLMSEVIAEVMPEVGPDRRAFLSGPSFAAEVARGLPADVVVASDRGVAARRLQPFLHAGMFRVYAGEDPIGVQVGGALKNIIAIAAGACDGMGLGDNARAGLITRGLAEITRLGVALGANPLTFLGLAGVGDLILTCTGELSRNRTLGKKLAEGVHAADYLAHRRSVAEGFTTAAAAHELARRLDVQMPITEQVFHVLHRGRPVRDAFQLLVAREFKDELVGLEAFLELRAPRSPHDAGLR
jgi:glycerol-3-phosphate dehydrogenase (NAD(P)+)